MTKAKPLPSLEKLLSLFDYQIESGLLIWKHKKRSHFNGRVAGYKNRGYIKIEIDGVEYMAHRIAWKIITGTDPGIMQVDHVNGNKTDNRFSNLRLASNAQNAMNRTISTRNSSGYKGVSYSRHRKKWIATIRVNGKSIYLGGFATPEDAYAAYCKAASELHGNFARTK